MIRSLIFSGKMSMRTCSFAIFIQIPIAAKWTRAEWNGKYILHLLLSPVVRMKPQTLQDLKLLALTSHPFIATSLGQEGLIYMVTENY